jgi:hypothetical protein
MKEDVKKEGKNRFKLELTILPTAMQNVDWQDRRLIIAGKGSVAETTVKISGTRRRWLKVTPDTLNFGAVSGSATKVATVTVKDTFLQRAFRVFEVCSPRAWIQCHIRELRAGVYRITAEINAGLPAQRGFFEVPIEVRTNDPHRRQFTIGAIGLNTGQ